MDNESKKKGNKGLIIIIVILSLLVVGLGYYFVSHEFFNSSSDVEKTNNSKEKDTEKDELNKDEIEYKFDADKIINKDTTYVYSLGNQNEKSSIISNDKTANGYKFCNEGVCEEITGEFIAIVGAQVFKGGPGITNSFDFLVSKSGDLYYANLDYTGKVITGSISEIKDVAKLYVIDLTSDRPASPNGSTVVAQTKDGSLYDLYEYVMK